MIITQSPSLHHINLLTVTASELQAKLANNSITSRELVQLYLKQIAQYNTYLKAVIAVAPKDLLAETAAGLDEERTKGNIRGTLHGISILVKVNIATVPELGLPTTCGSLALLGSKPRKNAAIIERASRTMSDFADWGWSAVGRQTQSAYVWGGFRRDDPCAGHNNPGGSSSGSAVAVAAGFSPVSIGTETISSLIMPNDRSALYTIKPTLKIVPQDGIIPASLEADSTGPMTKSVLDLANLLDVIIDPSKTIIPEGGYKSVVTGEWGNIRIGILEPDVSWQCQLRDWKSVYAKLASVAKVVKPVRLISMDEATENGEKDINNAFRYTFKGLLEGYLTSIDDCKVHTLADLIDFNKEHAEQELPPSANNQANLIRALHPNMTDEQYHSLLSFARDSCGKRGIDKTLEENGVDIIMGPEDGLLFSIAGSAGYPIASLPLNYLDFNGRTFGLQIITKAHQDALLIRAQSAWEATFPKRQPPLLDGVVS
nr:hypothetical protein L203_00941 [Cryptococcus depauperatus CBS 7841]